MKLWTAVAQTVTQDDTSAGRAFDLVIQALIVLSLVAFSVETLPNLPGHWRRALRAFEVATVAVFTVEYLVRFAVAERKLRFVFSFYGVVDALAILPFYVARGVDLRSLRIFRLFRLIRVLKLLRYGRAAEHFRLAFHAIKAELTLFLIACSFFLYLSSVGIYYFERVAQPEAFGSVFASMWWAVATLTTVGYGDVYPVTAGGKVFTTLILFIGLGVIAVPAGLIASALSQVFQREAAETQESVGDVGG